MDDITLWLILHKANSGRINHLAQHLNSARLLLEMSDAALQAHGVKNESLQSLRHPDLPSIEADLNWLKQNERRSILSWEDPLYPGQLKEIYDPPLILYIEGQAALLQNPQLALVGSRNPSPMGLELAKEFAKDLVHAGLTITSGLALGIDTASHQAALEAEGVTLAVLGSGLSHIYPRSNEKLADKIGKCGAIISEYSPNTKPLAHHFPQRNRLISGLSLGSLIIEASPQSGSLITARLAAEQGREVFAIPGSPRHMLAAGCNQLIQQGAKLVQTIGDLLEELNYPKPPERLAGPAGQELNLDVAQQKLLECIGFETSSVDQIATRSGLSVETTARILMGLELRGYINASAGGYIRKLAPSTG